MAVFFFYYQQTDAQSVCVPIRMQLLFACTHISPQITSFLQITLDITIKAWAHVYSKRKLENIPTAMCRPIKGKTSNQVGRHRTVVSEVGGNVCRLECQYFVLTASCSILSFAVTGPNEHSLQWTKWTQPSMDRVNTAFTGPSEHIPQCTNWTQPSMDQVNTSLNGPCEHSP